MFGILAWYKMNAADTSIPDRCIAPVSAVNSFQPQTSAFDVKRCRHRGNSIKTYFFWLAMSIFTSDGTTRHFFNILQIAPDYGNVPILISAIALSPPQCARSYSIWNPRRRKAALKTVGKRRKSEIRQTSFVFFVCFFFFIIFNLPTSNHCLYSSPSSVKVYLHLFIVRILTMVVSLHDTWK